jgi:pSer/pThr/pTyr-binding forkhead associated (FHA) protein
MAELRTPQGHALVLPDGRIAVGADLSNEVPVAAHFGLAPVHFRLQPWEGGHFVEDAGSGLGTLVNGHPIHWKPLVHGDRITAGELEVVYSTENSPALARKAPTSPVPAAAPTSPPLPLPAVNAPTAVSMVPPPTPRSWQPPVESPPPAWLPVDLLPEAYRPAVDTTAAAPFQENQPTPATRKTPRSKTAARRILPIAAALGLLGWSGHMAQKKHLLDPVMKLLQPASSQGQNPADPAPSISHPTPIPRESSSDVSMLEPIPASSPGIATHGQK